MQNKIQFYKDILSAEPLSRVFYPLAIVLAEVKEYKEAIDFLEKGLCYHPNFLEARLFLVELLSSFADNEELYQEKMYKELDIVIGIFTKFPCFWQAWSAKEKKEGGNTDIALAISFLGAVLRNPSLSFSDVFAKALSSFSSSTVEHSLSSDIDVFSVEKPVVMSEDKYAPVFTIMEDAVPITENITHKETLSTDTFASYTKESLPTMPSYVLPTEADEEHSHAEHEDVENFTEDTALASHIHTRSMADLLAEQGELEKALEIYTELLAQENNIEVKAELQFIIREFEEKLQEDIPAPKQTEHVGGTNKEKLINTLAVLVSRLDARAEAIQNSTTQ